MRVPQHRPAAVKYDGDPANRAMIALTQEDREIFSNLPLVTTLREPKRYSEKPLTTNPQPPKFYDEEQEKWSSKFEKSIKDRQDFKKKFMKTQKLTILNSNDNLKKTYDPEQTLKGSYTGGQLIPAFSEFRKVLKRRKSRQSTQMPCQVDFEYIGNDAGNMNYLVGKSN